MATSMTVMARGVAEIATATATAAATVLEEEEEEVVVVMAAMSTAWVTGARTRRSIDSMCVVGVFAIVGS